MTARAFPKDIKRPKAKLSGAVSVVCGKCRRRGTTNKALGFKPNQVIDECARCREGR